MPRACMDEALRQRGLLHALNGAVIDGLREHGERAARGLEAYRANAEAIAERALATAFTTVKAMVGADDFGHMARAFWQAQPPQRGDLGEWGDAIAAWLQAQPSMAPWPYLGDSARLDFALHRNERAADAAVGAASLALLDSVDPSQLRIRLMPGTALLRSSWPIASIHRAHQLTGDHAERAFERVREAIASGQGEVALVVRRGWRGVVETVNEADARWTESLLAGANVAVAFEQAGEGFDFAAWLQTAIQRGWLKDVVASND